jgi:hypothetical protein
VNGCNAMTGVTDVATTTNWHHLVYFKNGNVHALCVSCTRTQVLCVKHAGGVPLRMCLRLRARARSCDHINNQVSHLHGADNDVNNDVVDDDDADADVEDDDANNDDETTTMRIIIIIIIVGIFFINISISISSIGIIAIFIIISSIIISSSMSSSRISIYYNYTVFVLLSFLLSFLCAAAHDDDDDADDAEYDNHYGRYLDGQQEAYLENDCGWTPSGDVCIGRKGDYGGNDGINAYVDDLLLVDSNVRYCVAWS